MYKSLSYEFKAPLLNFDSSINRVNSSITKDQAEIEISANFYFHTSFCCLKKVL